MSTVRVRVLLFASFREAIGCNRVELNLREGTTVDQLFNDLQQEHPALGALRPYTTFAVNREVVPADTILHPGDEVALLQPVSGGARD